jgi:hypothetical protein
MEGNNMNSRKWRNPYTPINKKIDRITGGQAALTSLALTPKKAVQSLDLRTSVSRMRNNIKGISSTIRQMEETMDTLYTAMEMLDSLGSKAPKALPASMPKPAPKRSSGDHPTQGEEAAEQAAENETNLFSNIDVNQLLSLLQSPLVQSLLSQNSGSKSQRKKEG